MTSDLLTTSQVAELLGCSVRAVVKYTQRGHFPNARKMDPTKKNSPLRIPRADVEKYQKLQLIGTGKAG
jgi:predicted DNA-binding transcriptional regulator AlpA